MSWLALKNRFLGLLIFLPTATLAQENYAEYKKKYPDFNEVILNQTKSYNLSVVKDKLEIIRDSYQESIILSEPGIYNNKESFSYSDLVRFRQFDAYTAVNSNGREKKIKVTQTKERKSQDNSIFYDGVREKQLIFPNLEIGAKKVYQYQLEFTDPFLLHNFIFGNVIPVQNATLEVIADKDIEINYKIFNDSQNRIIFSKSDKKDKTIYRWTAQDISPVNFESNTPGLLHIVPHVSIYIKQYKANNKRVAVLDDTKQLYRYYNNFIKDLNKTEDAELKALTEEITAGQSSDLEKLKSIFYWVKDNVKYIAFENGYEGFIPREASLVFSRKFGDCKDMANLIVSMASYAKIKGAHLAWIGTRELPYRYEQLATPSADNHMIAVYDTGSGYVFLDATDKETRFGLPSSFIQDKEALIGKGDDFEIVKVPIVSPEENLTTENVHLQISDDIVLGTGTVNFSGYTRSHYLSQLGSATGKQRFDMIKSVVSKGNNKFRLDKFEEKNVSDRDARFTVDYTFSLGDYVVKTDKELYVNLNLDRVFENTTIDVDRKSDFQFDFVNMQDTKYILDIPAGYKLEHLPADSSIDNDLLDARFHYESRKHQAILHTTLILKKMLIKPEDFDLWRDTVKRLKSSYNQTLILTQTK